MSYKIIYVPVFSRQLKRLARKYPSLKKEFTDLLQNLENNPFLGKPIGKHCYKIRIPILSKGKGKSGGARIITFVQIKETTIYLLTIYDKAEQPDISDKELERILEQIS